MIHLLLILPLINAASSPLSGCEFLGPLADFDIVRNESLRRYQNGTFNIPMRKISSGERLGLYFKEDQVFYWNSFGEKKVYKKKAMEVWELKKNCHCMTNLVEEYSGSKFIRSEKGKICSQYLCSFAKKQNRIKIDPQNWCKISNQVGSFLQFRVGSSGKKLKGIIHERNVSLAIDSAWIEP